MPIQLGSPSVFRWCRRDRYWLDISMLQHSQCIMDHSTVVPVSNRNYSEAENLLALGLDDKPQLIVYFASLKNIIWIPPLLWQAEQTKGATLLFISAVQKCQSIPAWIWAKYSHNFLFRRMWIFVLRNICQILICPREFLSAALEISGSHWHGLAHCTVEMFSGDPFKRTCQTF